jgi:hypothetical protein
MYKNLRKYHKKLCFFILGGGRKHVLHVHVQAGGEAGPLRAHLLPLLPLSLRVLRENTGGDRLDASARGARPRSSQPSPKPAVSQRFTARGAALIVTGVRERPEGALVFV